MSDATNRRLWSDRVAEAFLSRVITIDGGLRPSRMALSGVDAVVFQMIHVKKKLAGRRGLVFAEMVEAKLSSVDPVHVQASLRRLQEWGRIFPVEFRDTTGKLYIGYREAGSAEVSPDTVEELHAMIRQADIDGLTHIEIGARIGDYRWEQAAERLACANLIIVRLVEEPAPHFTYHPVIQMEPD